MKSFFSFFAIFVSCIVSIFVLWYHSNTLLQKNNDIVIQEWSWFAVNDHHVQYDGVVYTRFIDGKKLEDVHTPWLLLEWNDISTQVRDDGNNTIQRPIERVMKDDFKESKELMAVLSVKNTSPYISEFDVPHASLDKITYKFSAIDNALSDYPLHAHVSLKGIETENTLYQESIEIVSSDPVEKAIITDFARCNNSYILTFKVSDDYDTVEYSTIVRVDCPLSKNIDVNQDSISNNLYNQLLTHISEPTQNIVYTPSKSLFWYALNILFSKLFIQAMTIKKIVI